MGEAWIHYDRYITTIETNGQLDFWQQPCQQPNSYGTRLITLGFRTRMQQLGLAHCSNFSVPAALM